MTDNLLILLILAIMIRVVQEYKPKPKKQGRSWIRQKIKNGVTYFKRWMK